MDDRIGQNLPFRQISGLSFSFFNENQKTDWEEDMAREYWKPSNMLAPVPAAIITTSDGEGHTDMMTAAWVGTVCSDPVMVSVSVRPSRLTHDYL